MPLDLAPHSRFARLLAVRPKTGSEAGKVSSRALIERLFPAVAFSHLAIGMILIRFALRLGNYFGSPIAQPPYEYHTNELRYTRDIRPRLARQCSVTQPNNNTTIKPTNHRATLSLPGFEAPDFLHGNL